MAQNPSLESLSFKEKRTSKAEGARRISQYEDIVQDSQFSWLAGAR